MRLLVLHRIDACLDKVGQTGLTAYETGSTPFDPNEPLDYERASSESPASASEDLPAAAENARASFVTVTRVSSKQIPQTALVQLRAVAATGGLYASGAAGLGDALVGAYLAGVERLHVGVLEGSEVREVRELDLRLRGERERREKFVGAGLVQLGRVLETVQAAAAARHREKARLSLVCEGGRLGVYERVGGEGRCLPDDVLMWFEPAEW